MWRSGALLICENTVHCRYRRWRNNIQCNKACQCSRENCLAFSESGYACSNSKNLSLSESPTMKKLPIGIQTFSEIIENDYVYVDKTDIAVDLIDRYKYVFLSRPRRFGKSLFVDTLHNLFGGNQELFSGLAIEKKHDWSKKISGDQDCLQWWQFSVFRDASSRYSGRIERE